MTLLVARDLALSFGRTQALRGLSVTIAPGEVVAITGASGSGKPEIGL